MGRRHGFDRPAKSNLPKGKSISRALFHLCFGNRWRIDRQALSSQICRANLISLVLSFCCSRPPHPGVSCVLRFALHSTSFCTRDAPIAMTRPTPRKAPLPLDFIVVGGGEFRLSTIAIVGPDRKMSLQALLGWPLLIRSPLLVIVYAYLTSLRVLENGPQGFGFHQMECWCF